MVHKNGSISRWIPSIIRIAARSSTGTFAGWYCSLGRFTLSSLHCFVTGRSLSLSSMALRSYGFSALDMNRHSMVSSPIFTRSSSSPLTWVVTLRGWREQAQGALRSWRFQALTLVGVHAALA